MICARPTPAGLLRRKASSKPTMGLEIFSINNKVIVDMEGKMRDSNARLYIGGLVMLVYLLIGAIVFVR
ncbi:hypothetical protein NECAME_17694 [Necator americanus]|uniref:Uncharacterized protein n=1 Tax=Necator americanus TaxID=51031 RepID=W2TLJ8_NECAM|nr:hypothetical protein NECAME_17694 [Necator americanus]ETN82504.1 hypothetical protein NECAME_17694 [Necator americanus]